MKVMGVTGWKNSGKTSLVVRLIEHFTAAGLQVATIKRAHCDFDIDQPYTDSYSHRTAGAREVLISSNRRWALMHELAVSREPELELDELLTKLTGADLVLVEGFKQAAHPKIQVVRPKVSTERLPADIPNVIALASDEQIMAVDYGRDCPVLDLDNAQQIANFIADYFD